jgi:hypothetical protein
VSLLPGMARAERDPRVAARGVAGTDLGRTIFAFSRRSATERPAVRALVAALRDAAGEHVVQRRAQPRARTASSALSSRGAPGA